jgi:ClpP class serine protease
MKFGIGDLVWLLFILSALQPLLRKAYLELARKRLIAKIERQRKSRVILMVHRQETMSLLGFPILRYIDINDSEEVIRAIHMTDPDLPLDLVLHTPGGLVLAATQIANAVHRHRGKVTVFVPYYAMSGGTLIALAADEIVMSEYAMLGPVDPQLGQYPAASIVNVRRTKPVDKIDDQTLILADQAEKALGQLKQSVKALLGRKCAPEQAEEIAELLTGGTWTHDFGITIEAAKQFGLCVRSDLPAEVWDLMSLFPQPTRRQQSVEYIPAPYPPKKEPPK